MQNFYKFIIKCGTGRRHIFIFLQILIGHTHTVRKCKQLVKLVTRFSQRIHPSRLSFILGEPIPSLKSQTDLNRKSDS